MLKPFYLTNTRDTLLTLPTISLCWFSYILVDLKLNDIRLAVKSIIMFSLNILTKHYTLSWIASQ